VDEIGSHQGAFDSGRVEYRRRHPMPVGRKRVLIASGDDDLRRWLHGQLGQTGEYLTIEACACDQALHFVESELLDAALVDLDMPESGGHELCRLLRRRSPTISIILLSTTRRSDGEEILAFEAGANDFLAGSFAADVLLARLRARFRDFEQTTSAVFEIGPYRFVPAKRLLIDRETRRRVQLTSKEAGVLRYLSQHPGESVSADQLLRQVWNANDDRAIKIHTVKAHVSKLRRKIERNAEKPEILVTRADGYSLASSGLSMSSGGGQSPPLARA